MKIGILPDDVFLHRNRIFLVVEIFDFYVYKDHVAYIRARISKMEKLRYGVTMLPESPVYLQCHKTGEGETEYLATLTYRYTAIGLRHHSLEHSDRLCQIWL